MKSGNKTEKKAVEKKTIEKETAPAVTVKSVQPAHALETVSTPAPVVSPVSEKELNPKRVAATGYGEFHPVASNNTEAGKSKNRRVEIVISPKKIGALN